jgi:hypothetical protein
MLQNAAFKQRFLNVAATLLGAHYSPARAVALVNTMQAELSPAVEEHRLRWQPAFGTVAGWQSKVDVIRAFAQNRAAITRSHFISQFGLTGTSNFTLTVGSSGGSGGIRADGVLLNTSAVTWPATIPYFNGQTLTLEAAPAAGWEFSHWVGVADTTSVITVPTTGAKSITAHFRPLPPRRVAIQLTSENQWRITVEGTPKAPYKLQWSDDLVTWQDLTNVTTDSVGRAAVNGSVTGQRRFYRAVP